MEPNDAMALGVLLGVLCSIGGYLMFRGVVWLHKLSRTVGVLERDVGGLFQRVKNLEQSLLNLSKNLTNLMENLVGGKERAKNETTSMARQKPAGPEKTS